MWRKALGAILAVSILAVGLAPVTTRAQWVVYDPTSDIHNTINWATQFTKWTTQISYMINQYQQLVQTYQWAQHVAKTLQNPDLFTVLSLYAVVNSGTLTKIDSVEDFRRMVEGSTAYGANLGRMYQRIYGEALDLGHMAPRSPEDWGAAAKRANAMIQGADAAALETLALVSKVNRSLSDVDSRGTYTSLQNKIKSGAITPEQTAQAGALSSLYTAQSVDKNTQVLAALAAMQAQQVAQQEAAQKQGLINVYTEQQYFTQSGNALRNEGSHVDSWKIR